MHITHLAIGESPVILQMFRDCELKIQQVYRHKPIPFKLVDLTNFNGNICVRLAGEYLLACQDIYQKKNATSKESGMTPCNPIMSN